MLISHLRDSHGLGGRCVVVGRRPRTRGPRRLPLLRTAVSTGQGPPACFFNARPIVNTDFGCVQSETARSTLSFLPSVLQRDPMQLAMTQLNRNTAPDVADVSRMEVGERLVHIYAQLERLSSHICPVRNRRSRRKGERRSPCCSMGKRFPSSVACKQFPSCHLL